MLLGEREMTLKAEQGQETRRGFCVLERKNAQPAPLDEEAADRAQHILQSQNGPTLPLCWQRYAIDRSLVLETFIFQWLAFEGLAGTTQVPHKCPGCGLHYGRHEGSNKDRAFEMYSSIDPKMTRSEFNRRIWGRARNGVFHGSAYPKPAFLSELGNEIKPILRRACLQDLSAKFNLPPMDEFVWWPERTLRYFTFFEWNTSRPAEDFATDIPFQILQALADGRGGEAINSPEADKIGFSIINSGSETW